MLVQHKHAEIFHKKKRTIDVNNLLYFFHITDIHLDILYSKYVSSENWQMCRNMSRRSGKPVNLTDGYAEFGRVGCDASEALVKSAASYMEEINGNLTKPIDFIIISGDLCCTLLYFAHVLSGDCLSLNFMVYHYCMVNQIYFFCSQHLIVQSEQKHQSDV